MTARRILVVAVAALLAAPHGAALAQASGAQPGKVQIEDAMFRLRVMSSALEAKNVAAPIKDAIAGCLYQNSFQKISDTMDKAIAGSPTKIDKRNPTQTLEVMALVCGYKPPAATKAPPAAAPKAPAPRPATPKPGQKAGR